MSQFDVVVVGGGVSGMTAALLFGASGRSVALVESFPRLAPTIRGFRRQGVHFDTGLHYVGALGPGDPLETYFKHLGIFSGITPVSYDAAGFETICFEKTGESFTLPIGQDALLDAFSQWFPEERPAIAAYFENVRRIFESSSFLNFSLPFSMQSDLHTEAKSLANFLHSVTDNEKLKVLLSYPCLLYGVAPENALLSTHALVAGSYYRSVHAIAGGGGAVARSFQERLVAAGVEILCGNAVKHIHVTNEGAFSGVTLENEQQVLGDICIWAAHPKAMIEAAPPGALRSPYRQRVRSLEETQSALMTFALSYGQPIELERRNLILWPGGEFGSKLAGNAAMPDNVMFFFAGQGAETAKRPVTALCPMNASRFMPWSGSQIGKRPAAYKLCKREALEEFQNNIVRRLPRLGGGLEFVEGATPLTIRDYCLAPGGGLYGVGHGLSQFNLQPLTRIRGLLLCGQSIVAPGILGAVVSAYLACGFILGHESLHEQLQEAL